MEPSLEESKEWLRRRTKDDWKTDKALHDLMHQLLQDTGADEATLWLLSGSEALLLPKLNVGSKDDSWMEGYQHPIDLGFIGLVALNEKGMLNSEVQKSADHDDYIDTILTQTTLDIAAVPFYLQGQMIGVLSAVELKPQPGAEVIPFSSDSLTQMQQSAEQMGQHLIRSFGVENI